LDGDDLGTKVGAFDNPWDTQYGGGGHLAAPVFT
jgi:hypothetical protein